MVRKLPLLIVAALAASAAFAQTSRPAPTRAELDGAMQWLAANPPDGRNVAERRQRMAILQRAADQLPPRAYFLYDRAPVTAPADHLAADGILYCLRAATTRAAADLRATRVERGLAVWHFYNMGYAFRTPDATFGIDLSFRGAEALAADLDFLLVTHRHGDHCHQPLVDAMLRANKPVVTGWQRGSRVVALPTTQSAATAPSHEMRFGPIRVKVDIGDHHMGQPTGRNNMLMYQIDCGPNANDRTIYHSGDNSNFRKMLPDRAVDVFIPHVSVGMNIPQAIRHMRPRMTLASHVLELGHSPTPPQAWRWSFDDAFNTIADFPQDRATVLTWGERWLTPQTILRGR